MEPIPWWEPKLGRPVRDAALRVLDGGYINDGSVTRALEERLAEIAGVGYGIATPNCTTALAIALMAAGIGPGDDVIVPDFTFIATANAVRLAGGAVKLVDVEAERLTIGVDRVAAAIGPRTRAVLAVDMNGRAPDYDALEALCRSRGLTLICDSAEALGSRRRERALGSFGAAGCYSFSASKLFFGGQGGAVVTDDVEMERRLRDLRDHGRREAGAGDDVRHVALGFNFKLPNLLASVILAQLEELEERLAHARSRDRWYRDRLSDCPGLSFPGGEAPAGEVCLWGDVFVEDQAGLMRAFLDEGVGFRRFFLPLHRQPPYRQDDGPFPNAIRAWERGIWLPSALSLTIEQADRVAEICRRRCGASRHASLHG